MKEVINELLKPWNVNRWSESITAFFQDTTGKVFNIKYAVG